MTRLSLALPNAYPRQFVWWMECDVCKAERSRPAWRQADLPLDDFRLLGWDCGSLLDTCPGCVAILHAEGKRDAELGALEPMRQEAVYLIAFRARWAEIEQASQVVRDGG